MESRGRGKKNKHWSHRYLTRINSTEVTVRKAVNLDISKRIMTLPNLPAAPHQVLSGRGRHREEEAAGIERTPDRMIGTPGRKVHFLTPTQFAKIPMTPHSSARPGSGEPPGGARSRKRLFW